MELFRQGQLTAAIEAMTAAVRTRPSDVAARSLLVELLCFQGDLERADRQLDALVRIDPQVATGVSLLRHLLRAETSRREVFERGRVPEFSGTPGKSLELRLRALTEVRQGNPIRAVQLVRDAESVEPELTGSCNGLAFSGFRDLDDLLGPVLEVVTATGAYYWIDAADVELLEPDSITHLVDMLWRPATLQTRTGIHGRVHLPALYFGSERCADGALQLGHATDWLACEGLGLVRGLGRREYLTGEVSVTILELKSLVLAVGAET